MARKKSVEEEQYENAEVIETAEVVEEATQLSPGEQLIHDQFGGEEGEPIEGVERWDDMVREQVLQADGLSVERQAVYKRQESNRTLLRALRDMGKLDPAVVEVYYKTQARAARG